MRKIYVLLFSILSTVAFAQLTAEEVEQLEPSHYQTKVIVTSNPAYIEMGGLNFGYGYGLDVEGFVMKRFSYSAGLTKSYSDDKFKNGNDPFTSDSYQGIKKAGASHVNFNFHLIDKIGMGRIRVEKYKGIVNTSSGGYGHAYDIYKKRGPVRKILAVRGGLYGWKSGVSPESGDTWNLLTEGSNSSPSQATERNFTNLYTSNFSVGLMLGKFVSGTAMGAAGVVSYYRNFYIDILLNTKTKLDDNLDSFDVKSKYQLDQGNLTKVPMGWRAGWRFMGLGRKYWVGGYYLEGGIRPGIEGRGPYLQMGLILGLKYPFIPIKS